jgi:hypothetical protein
VEVHERRNSGAALTSFGIVGSGAVGAAVGLLAGVGALAIPGLGPFIAAGPIMAALNRAAAGLRPYPIQPGALTIMWYDMRQDVFPDGLEVPINLRA